MAISGRGDFPFRTAWFYRINYNTNPLTKQCTFGDLDQVTKTIFTDFFFGGTTGGVNYWTGAAWTVKPFYVWTGAWTVKPLKVWTGAAWETKG